MSLGTIQIPVLFDMSGDTIVFGEEATGDFVTSHLDFALDMTTEANDISLNAADISAAILIGDQETGDNIFYSGGTAGNVAVDNLCNRIAKAITRGKLVHLPKSGDHSNSGIPMGGRLELRRADGQVEVPPDGRYAIKYLTSISPIGDEQMLGEAMARVASIHLVGTPLAANILVDKNSVQSDLETTSGQTFNSGNTAFYNALAVQLSKVLGGSKSSSPMNPGVTASVPGGDLTSQEFYENFDSLTVGDKYNMGGTGANDQAMVVDGTGTTNYGANQSPHPDPRVPGSLYIRLATTQHNNAKLYYNSTTVRAISFWHHFHQSPYVHATAGQNSLIASIVAGNTVKCEIVRGGEANTPSYKSNYGGSAAGSANIQWWVNGVKITTGEPVYTLWSHTPTNLYQWHHHYIDLGPGYTANDITQVRMGTIHSPTQSFQYKNYGYLDDIRFFNERLTDAQIINLSTGGNGNPGGGTIVKQPLDASGVAVPALKSIYEQLMNVPGRSQIMETRDVSGVRDNSNVTIAGGFPFISGDKLVMFLRPKIVFASQTQAEQLNAIQAFNYTGSTILGTPAYNIADKNGPITGQTYSQSSSQNNTMFIFEKATTGAGVAGDIGYWTSAGSTYNNTTGVHEGANANGTTTNVDVGTTPPATTTTYTVTVGDNGGNKFKIDGAFNPTLTFVKGNTYIFDQSDATNSGHQIQISETSAGGNASYATTVGTPGTAGAKTTVVVPTNAVATLYYNCNPHGASMGNSISVTSPPNSIDGEWGQVDVGESSWATELQLTTNNAYNDRSPREFRLLGSTDGTNWKTLIHETEAGPWLDSTSQTFTISNPTSYRYYRYVVIKCYNAVNAGNIDSRTSIGHFNLRGVKYPSEVVEVTNAGLMNGSPLDISGLQTNVVATAANIQDAFPGNDTSGPEAEVQRWGWMGSANSDTLSLDTTDITNVRTIDLHIWKITITL